MGTRRVKCEFRAPSRASPKIVQNHHRKSEEAPDEIFIMNNLRLKSVLYFDCVYFVSSNLNFVYFEENIYLMEDG